MINKKIFILLLVFIYACSDEPTKSQDAVNPEIISIRINGQWNLNAQDSILVEIKVTDPQGFDDLKNIAFKVFDDSDQLVFTDSLYDDGGLNGTSDLIAGDGVFRNLFLPSLITPNEGSFTFDFEVKDKAGNSAGELKKEVTFAFNEAPVINNISVPPQLLSGLGPWFVFVTVFDQDGANKNMNVFLDLLQNDQSVLNETLQLFNDGNTAENGDIFADDSVFSFKMDSSFAAGRTGDYIIKLVAEDEFGNQSPEMVKSIFIENKTGKILNVSVPDIIVRPSQGFATALVTAKVTDPQSLMDVDSVYFNSIKPDGSAAGGNPFVMLDNGLAFNIDNPFIEVGDEIKGDGIYSITILVDKSNLPGVYNFTFNMRDKVGNLATAITDSIEVQ